VWKRGLGRYGNQLQGVYRMRIDNRKKGEEKVSDVSLKCEKCGYIIHLEEFVRFVKCQKCGHRNKVKEDEKEDPKTIGHHFGIPVRESIIEQ